MCVIYLGFVLLACFPGLLHAQSTTESCPAPRLEAGYWVPVQDFYKHETKLPYACNKGRKPAAEGWWATSTCLNGIWSPQPQCIDEKACIAADIANAKYTEQQGSWYEDGHTIRITCNEEYDPKGWKDTAKCIDGKWSPVLVCEKSLRACGAPPQIPHAVIILQGYQDLFAAGTELQYECEDGYTVEGRDTKTSIHCIARKWTDGPVCNTQRDAGLGGSADVGAAGSGTQAEGGASRPGTGHGGGSAGSGTQAEGGASRPGTGHGGGSAGSETQPEGGASRPGTGHGGGSAGSGTQPEGGVSVERCGEYPQVQNGDVVLVDALFLRYQCNSYYTQVGSDTVTCHNNDSWSQLPVCQVAFCALDPTTALFPRGLKPEPQYIKEGEEKFLPCIWRYYSSRVRCINGEIYFTRCCQLYYHEHGRCN